MEFWDGLAALSHWQLGVWVLRWPGLWGPEKDEVSEELGSSFGEKVADASMEGNVQGQLQ